MVIRNSCEVAVAATTRANLLKNATTITGILSRPLSHRSNLFACWSRAQGFVADFQTLSINYSDSPFSVKPASQVL